MQSVYISVLVITLYVYKEILNFFRAGTVLNLPFVQEHLAIFIKEKENLQEALHAKLVLLVL